MTELLHLATATGPLDAVVTVPGSKSIANRALVCAALADGAIRLHRRAGRRRHRGHGPLPAGARRRRVLDGDEARIAGTGGRLAAGPITLDAALAGTTSRFVTAVAALAAGPVTIDGAPPLRGRPMGPLHEALVALGAGVQTATGPAASRSPSPARSSAAAR